MNECYQHTWPFLSASVASSRNGTVVAVCVSEHTGTAKVPVASGEFIADKGLRGDGHAGTVRQVSLLMAESIDDFNANFAPEAQPGEFAENIVTRGIDLRSVRVGDRIRLGQAIIEVTQIGKEVLPNHYSFHGHRLLPTQGVFCRVIAGGVVEPGTPVVLDEPGAGT